MNCFMCFTCVNSFNPQDKSLTYVLLSFAFYWSEQLSNMPKVTEQVEEPILESRQLSSTIYILFLYI